MADRNWNRIDIQNIKDYYSSVSGNVVLGIDGIIDEVWLLVKERRSVSECSIYESMSEFGKLILNREGSGMGVEILRKHRNWGGFTCNTGNALSCLGIKPVMIGMFGREAIDPVFKEFPNSCKLISLGDPAVCHIFEFDDGKIMFPYVESIISVNWNSLEDKLDSDALKDIFSTPDIITIGYWSSMTEFDAILENICEYVDNKRPIKFFFDFADLKKRTRSALEFTLNNLKRLNQIAPMTLSLNDNEAETLFSCFSEKCGADAQEYEASLDSVRRRIGIDELIVHTPHFAAGASVAEGTASIPQRHCIKAKKTVGAGDTFNGGYISASLGSLDILSRLAVANSASSFYVSRGCAPGRNDLIDEMTAIMG
ncbi:MAG: carbohydrate kinase family protein [Clostridiales bacterium]|nr:carbohydrate kinase family protein [Clostridiales bacterium]